jgi:hypothetical protein
MKKQNKLGIKVRDLELLKDVTGGRRHSHRLHAGALKVQHCDDTEAWAPSDRTGLHNGQRESRTWFYPTLRFLIVMRKAMRFLP